MQTRETVEWAAQLSNVREVTLSGSADLAYWRRRLKAEGLRPAELEGRARFLLIGSEAKFAGLGFRELSFSILLSDEGSAFLLQGFNSSRLFAFSERTFFSTPYLHGQIGVSTRPSPSLTLSRSGTELLRAEMGGGSLVRSGIDGWEGRVLLRSAQGEARCFFARIHGATERRPFGEGDSFLLGRHPGLPLFGELADSGFTPAEWLVRHDAVHRKSKTYAR